MTRQEVNARGDANIEHAEELFKVGKCRLNEIQNVVYKKLGRVEKKIATIEKTITKWDIESMGAPSYNNLDFDLASPVAPSPSSPSGQMQPDIPNEQGAQQPTPSPDVSDRTVVNSGAEGICRFFVHQHVQSDIYK